MTLEDAFAEFISSSQFKMKAKEDAKYRVYLGRFKNGTIRTGAMVELLLANGYEVKANKAKRRK